MYKCSPEQLRKVSQEQESLIRMLPEDLLSVRKLMHEKGSGNYIDLSTREKPPVLEGSQEINEDDDAEMFQGFGGMLREREENEAEERRVRLRLEGNEGSNDGYSPTSLAQTPVNNPVTPSETPHRVLELVWMNLTKNLRQCKAIQQSLRATIKSEKEMPLRGSEVS